MDVKTWTPDISWIGHDHGVAMMRPAVGDMWVSVSDYQEANARADAAEERVERLQEGEARLSLLLNETAKERDAAEAALKTAREDAMKEAAGTVQMGDTVTAIQRRILALIKEPRP